MTAALHLPGADKAVVARQRIVDYLLNIDHTDGTSKAKFFLGRGFTADSWNKFSDALLTHGRTNTVKKVTEDKWGVRFRVECTLVTPDGSNPCIRTVWLLETNAKFPRLITAHPF